MDNQKSTKLQRPNDTIKYKTTDKEGDHSY